MILDKFLNLKGTSIQGYLHLENIGIVCRIESKNQKAICPRCGLESDKLHQNHRHLVKDLPISGQPVYLQVNRRQFKCDNCRKPFSEELDFVAKKRTYTKRLAENILEQLKSGDIFANYDDGVHVLHITTCGIQAMKLDEHIRLP
ncbi:MAG: transposase family protein, partial [Microcystis panniformis]